MEATKVFHGPLAEGRQPESARLRYNQVFDFTSTYLTVAHFGVSLMSDWCLCFSIPSIPFSLYNLGPLSSSSGEHLCDRVMARYDAWLLEHPHPLRSPPRHFNVLLCGRTYCMMDPGENIEFLADCFGGEPVSIYKNRHSSDQTTRGGFDVHTVVNLSKMSGSSA